MSPFSPYYRRRLFFLSTHFAVRGVFFGGFVSPQAILFLGPFRPARALRGPLAGGRTEPSACGAEPYQGLRPAVRETRPPALGAVRAPRAGTLSINLPAIHTKCTNTCLFLLKI